MATLASIVQRVRNTVYGAFPTEAPFVTTLAASHNISATTVTVLEEDNWAAQDILENQETNEEMLVLSVTTDGSDVLTVIRAWEGSTAAASVGADDVLVKNPRFRYSQISQAITETLASLESWGIYVHGNTQITRADPAWFYELAVTDVVEPMGVLRAYEVEVNASIPRSLPFRYQHNLGTNPAEYSVGAGVTMQDWGATLNTEEVELIYAKKIAATTDLLTRQEELVVLGAVARLLGATIVPATHDPGARSDRTVQPGQTGRDWGNFQGRFINMARQEAGLLAVERQKFLAEVPKYARARRWSG